MVIPDEGPSNPALPADAGPNERKLYGIYGFSTVLVRMTADDWGTTADTVSNLATEVRSVITKLQGADRPWTGPAADAAYATLQRLAGQLDDRAEEITGIKRGLNQAADAADTARQAYQNTVRTISTDVDRSSYEHTQARQGGQPAPDGKVFDQAGFDAAVAAQREQREQQSATVLAGFGSGIRGAAREMPVAAQDSVTIDPGSSGGGGGGGGYPSGGGPSGGSYVAPSGGGGGGGVYHVSHPTGWVQEPVVENPQPPTTTPPTTTPPVEPPAPVSPVSPTPTPVHLDGGTTGTVTPGGAGSTGWAGTAPGGGSSGGGAGGLGGAGAVGGGALMGGAALLGKGVLGRMGGGAFGAAGAAGRPGLVAGSTSAAGRGAGGAAGRGAAGAAGRTTVAPGGQGAAARGGARGAGGGRGAAGVTGSRSTGKYGVPKVGESGGRGAGAKGAVGAASGGRGGRRGRDEQAQDVDHLTHEDEETWFEGEDDATPPVWR
ncbi:WXG100 family type VII secretion target [Phycicoccus jejuensis]|uniref:WXG100 family type VII secretion target n=1 Tax=Phycicoccus jejuensis TaxID=367299 RepID=UPI0004C36091|nr:WXG100 family type VII secretion target [Phycicoccus jejuensis]